MIKHAIIVLIYYNDYMTKSSPFQSRNLVFIHILCDTTPCKNILPFFLHCLVACTGSIIGNLYSCDGPGHVALKRVGNKNITFFSKHNRRWERNLC